jgi:competence protein ComFC
VNFCLLCDKTMTQITSWRSLVGLDERRIICPVCLSKFEHVGSKVESSIIDCVTSLYTYNDAMRDYLHQFKFLQDVALAGVFANELRPHLKRDAVVVPIPMHPEKRIARTFAHVDEILIQARIPYRHVLEKSNVEAMGEKSKEERLAMRPLFTLKPQTTIKPHTYILIDDIYTTGTTLLHAATVLKEAGAKRVEAITLIRA